jgi:hypothetical protein
MRKAMPVLLQIAFAVPGDEVIYGVVTAESPETVIQACQLAGVPHPYGSRESDRVHVARNAAKKPPRLPAQPFTPPATTTGQQRPKECSDNMKTTMITVVFRCVGPLLSMKFGGTKRILNAEAAGLQPRRFQRGPRPASAGLTYPNVVGLLHFKSAASWLRVVCGLVLALAMVQMPLPIAVPATAAALFLAVLAYLRPKRAVQGCNIDQTGAITLIRGGTGIPFDLSHYRYIRMHSSRARSVLTRWH